MSYFAKTKIPVADHNIWQSSYLYGVSYGKLGYDASQLKIAPKPSVSNFAQNSTYRR